MQIEVLTLNTWKAEGAYLARIGCLLEELKALRPGIILLQEVFRSFDNRFCTLRRLAAGLGMEAAFLPMRRKPRLMEGRWIDSFSGMGILSAFPMTYMEAVELPSTAADGGRVGQLVKVSAGKTRILLGNVHLSFLEGQDDLKIHQLQRLLDRMCAQEESDAVFLGGDLNSVPESAVLDFLRRYPPFRVFDTFALAGAPGNPGWTLPLESAQGKRIDYLFSLSSPERTPPRILKSEVVFKEAGPQGLLPSDHYGVFSQFQLDH